MKLRIFILFLFLPLLRAQASVIDSLMTHPRDSIGLTSDSLVLHFLEESGIPISDNNKVKLLKLIELLRQESDEQHPMCGSIVCQRLSEMNISCDRKTLTRDIAALNEYGYEVWDELDRRDNDGYRQHHRTTNGIKNQHRGVTIRDAGFF